MGIFDSLLGTKTNDALNDATKQVGKTTQSTVDTNENYLTRGYNDATGALTSNTSGALASLLAQYGAGSQASQNYGGAAQGALGQGVNQAVGTVQGSNGLFQPYVDTGTKANSLYGDALGLNGATGNDTATAAFRAAPGYSWSVDQATDAAARKAASLGMAGSGNTLDAITRLGSNLADQQFGSWLDRLSGASGQGLTAAGQISGNNNAAAGYQFGGGGVLSQLLQQLGTSSNANSMALGNQQAALQSGLGTNTATLATGLGNSLTSNQWHGTDTINQANLGDAQQQDAVDSANNGIFNKLIGGIGSSLLGGTATGKALGGLFSKL